ncbi:MAG: PRC-barrel domain-containing protein [Pseudomonadota bacterium]
MLNERNETVGEIEDLIINASGGAPTAVISVGGFLGIGARLVAVPLSELSFNAERERWVLNGATKESLQQRPAYTYQRS